MWVFWHSRGSNSKVNSPILPEPELFWDFMPVHVIRNFHKDPIETKQAMLQVYVFFSTKEQVTPKSIVLSSQSSNTFETLCMSRLSASLIKIQLTLNRLCPGQGQIWCFWHSRARNYEVNGLIWPEMEHVQDFMTVFVTCKFNEDPIKSKVAILQTTFPPV